jgi:uncharacterized protein (DUF362 family)
MNRRGFLALPGACALAHADTARAPIPDYRTVSPHAPRQRHGMPGPYPGRVVRVRSDRVIDEGADRVDADTVREMLARGMCALTGDTDAGASWRRLFQPADVVGIKVNCVGRPHVMSSPEVVSEIVRRLIAAGVPAEQIHLYERFTQHLEESGYGPHLPEGVQLHGAEAVRGSNDAYDPFVYVETSFFGEDDTRSNLVRLVSDRLTKVINVPVVKDHGAAGITGCLKNIAYGSFSNVARSHAHRISHTYSFIGTLAAVEPLRSRTVLQIADGLRAVWNGGPFAANAKFRFYPKQLVVGTDPVAIDTLLLDVIEERRRAEKAPSVWDRSAPGNLVREPGHISYAAALGLGVADRARIAVRDIEV